MRNKILTIGAAALLLATTTVAWAQAQPQPTPTPSNGTLDIGGRLTTTTGDEARYERYRDLRDGLNANLLYSKQTEKWAFDLKATNIGYRDQRYTMNFSSRRLKGVAVLRSDPDQLRLLHEDALQLHRGRLLARPGASRAGGGRDGRGRASDRSPAPFGVGLQHDREALRHAGSPGHDPG
jgi:hypothetical protein